MQMSLNLQTGDQNGLPNVADPSPAHDPEQTGNKQDDNNDSKFTPQQKNPSASSNLAKSDNFFGASGYSSSDSSDFSDDSLEGYVPKADKVGEGQKNSDLDQQQKTEESKACETQDMSDSEDSQDEISQMLMKSSTKHFNHVICQQSKIQMPMLCEARPVGQSRLTKLQKSMLRTNSQLSRIHKNHQLVHKLTKQCSRISVIGAKKAMSTLTMKTMPNKNVLPVYDQSEQQSADARRQRRMTAPSSKSVVRAAHLEMADFQDSFRKTGLRRLVTIPEHDAPATPKMSRTFSIPPYVWFHIMTHLDLKFVLSRLMCLDIKTREFFMSLNSALFDMFTCQYGLSSKLRRTDLPGKIDLIPFLTRLERQMVRARYQKDMAEQAYREYIQKWLVKKNQTASSKRSIYQKHKSQTFFARPDETDDLIFEFDQKQFVAGKQIQVFPFITDGGLQCSQNKLNTMFELFNSRYKSQQSERSFNNPAALYGNPFGGGHLNSRDKKFFKQYISASVKDVSVCCYLGRDCGFSDQKQLEMRQIYNRTVAVSSTTSAAAIIASKAAADSKDLANSISVAAAEPTSKKLRGVLVEQYFLKEDEKESYKMLHQIEFNSFREQATQSAKMNSQMHDYDDYYYEDQPQAAYESNQKSVMIFLVHSYNSIYRSEQLRALDSESLPDLQAFQKLGFPLKQTVKVQPRQKSGGSANQSKKSSSLGQGEMPQTETLTANHQRPLSSEDAQKLYSFQTLPVLETAVGEKPAQDLLDQIVEDEKKEQDSSDFGCICEIDLTQRVKISKIMSRLLYPPKSQSMDSAVNKASAAHKSSDADKKSGITKSAFLSESEQEEKKDGADQVTSKLEGEIEEGKEETKTQVIVTTASSSQTDKLETIKQGQEEEVEGGAGACSGVDQAALATEKQRSSQSQQQQQQAGTSESVGSAQKSVSYLDVLPLLYIKNYSNGQVLERWALRFQQKIGAKYLIVKTLNSLGATENQHSNKTKNGLHHGQFILYGEKMPGEF